jgi:Tfp pilus assembly PilM family ATPase
MTRIQLSPRGLRGLSIGVSGSDVIVKQVPLPLMDESEGGGCAALRGQEAPAVRRAALVLDHQVLGRNTVERRLDVLLATVSQQRLERMLAPLRELGVEADIVDAAPLALSNALTHWFGREPAGDGEVRLLLDLGHRGSWLTLRQKSQPFFARRLDWGGAQLTQAIAASLGGSLERADAWKLDPGYFAGAGEPRGLRRGACAGTAHRGGAPVGRLLRHARAAAPAASRCTCAAAPRDSRVSPSS